MITKEQLLKLDKDIRDEANGLLVQEAFYLIASHTLLEVIDLAYRYLDLCD